MNIGKGILLGLLCLAVLLACTVGFMASQGLGISVAVVIEPSRRLILLGGSPVSLSGVSLERYSRGARVLILHGLIAESYPGQAHGSLALRLPGYSEIPDAVLASLREMGWVS